MKVVMVIDSLRDGGKERRATELLQGLSRYSDVDCKVILLKDSIHYKEVLDLGFEVIVFKRVYKRDISVFKKVFNVIRNYQPDVIHSWGSMPSIYCMPSLLWQRRPFINAMISNSKCPVMSKNWIRSKLTFPFSDVILANSNIGIKAYHVPAAKARVIHNGFCLKRVEGLPDRNSVLEEFGWKERQHHFFVGMVASIDYRKDFPLFVKAANAFLALNKDVTFLIIGDGPDREEVEALVAREHKNNILFLGKRRNVERLVNILDVGVLCTHGEGTSNAIMEYMACQKPVVATRVDGNAELLKDGELGILVENGNSQQLVQTWQELKDDKNLANQLATKAYNHIVNHMNNKIVVQQYIDLYKQLTQ